MSVRQPMLWSGRPNMKDDRSKTRSVFEATHQRRIIFALKPSDTGVKRAGKKNNLENLTNMKCLVH